MIILSFSFIKTYTNTTLTTTQIYGKLRLLKSTFMKKLRKSFGHAANGLKETLIHERNFKIMLGAALAIIAAMFYLPTSRAEKAILATTIFCRPDFGNGQYRDRKALDFLHPAHHEEVRVIKDLMAAIVLIASFGAAIIGLMIFWPYVFNQNFIFQTTSLRLLSSVPPLLQNSLLSAQRFFEPRI